MCEEQHPPTPVVLLVQLLAACDIQGQLGGGKFSGWGHSLPDTLSGREAHVLGISLQVL